MSLFRFKNLCSCLAEMGIIAVYLLITADVSCSLTLTVFLYIAPQPLCRDFNSCAFPLIRQWHIAVIRSEILLTLLLSPHFLLLPGFCFRKECVLGFGHVLWMYATMSVIFAILVLIFCVVSL